MSNPLSRDVIELLSENSEGPESDLLRRVEEQSRTGSAHLSRSRPPQSEVVVGTYRGRNSGGNHLVDFTLNPEKTAIEARSVISLGINDVGHDVVLAFNGGDLSQPIVLGLVQSHETQVEETLQTTDVRVDGERVTIEAHKEVVIKCGEASITLTTAGKILIRGTYVVSRSSGANRIKGASVEVN